ncbi:hypothetical protein [Pseudomonas sp. Marseille-QA0892]
MSDPKNVNTEQTDEQAFESISPSGGEKEQERHPSEADDDQVDEALEETFPASDPISP